MMNITNMITDNTPTQAINAIMDSTTEVPDNTTALNLFGNSHSDSGIAAADVTHGMPKILSNDKLYWEYYLGKSMMDYMIPAFVILGIFGNLLVFATLIQKRPMTSTTIYLLNLALADFTITFLGPLIRRSPRFLTGYDIIHKSVFICQNWWFLANMSMHMSAWTMMAITLERVFIVYKPLKAKGVCTVRTAGFVLLIIYFVCSVSNIHIYWTYRISKDKKGKETVTNAGCVLQKNTELLKYYIITIRPWQDFIIRSAVPFTTLLTGNLLIIYKLAMRNRNGLIQYAKKKQGFTSLSVMLVVVSFTHLICTVPLQVLYFVDKIGPFAKPVSSHAQSVAAIRWSIAINLINLNHSINFILYCISGKQFREDLKRNVLRKIWCRSKSCLRQNRNHLSGGNSSSVAEAGSKDISVISTNINTETLNE